MKVAAAMINDHINGSIRIRNIFVRDIADVRPVRALAAKKEQRDGRASDGLVRAWSQMGVSSASRDVRAVCADDGRGGAGSVAGEGVK